jgi:hypothetical protein
MHCYVSQNQNNAYFFDNPVLDQNKEDNCAEQLRNLSRSYSTTFGKNSVSVS